MIQVPTPAQQALVAQMLQGAIGQPIPNAPVRPDGGYSFGRRAFIHPPTPYVGMPGYRGPGPDQPIEDAPAPMEPLQHPAYDGGYSGEGIFDHGKLVARQGFAGNHTQPDPISVFGKMRQALPVATRSKAHSHQQALIARMMQNMRGVKG
jgi:hypothetical protein